MARDETQKTLFDDLGRDRLTRLLRLGRNAAREPVEDLAARLRRPDGAAWIHSVDQSGSLGPPGLLAQVLAGGGPGLKALRDLKGRGGELLQNRHDEEALLRGLLGYFLAIAAGLVHHDTLLTRQEPGRVRPLLRLLAGAAPPPWGPHFAAAGERPLFEV